MKFKQHIIVNLPREKFIQKLINLNNLKFWQVYLKEFDYISGTPGEVGSKMQYLYAIGKKNIAVTQTITHKNIPKEFFITNETKGMQHTQENYFEETANGCTKWTCVNEFFPSSFISRLKLLILPDVYKKQSKSYMINFKEFAEKK